jgi:hypothetical protein
LRQDVFHQFFVTGVLHVLIPNSRYRGQKPQKEVTKGSAATKPHQELKYKPAIPITTAAISLTTLSVLPILLFIEVDLPLIRKYLMPYPSAN